MARLFIKFVLDRIRGNYFYEGVHRPGSFGSGSHAVPGMRLKHELKKIGCRVFAGHERGPFLLLRAFPSVLES